MKYIYCAVATIVLCLFTFSNCIINYRETKPPCNSMNHSENMMNGKEFITVELLSDAKCVSLLKPFSITIRVMNITEEKIVIESPGYWEWIEISDSNNKIVPKVVARISGNIEPTPELFIVIDPGKTIERKLEIYWVKEKIRASEQLNVDFNKVEFIDQGYNYACVSAGIYRMRFKKLYVLHDKLKHNDKWISVEKYYGAKYYKEPQISNYIQVEFIK